jgi:hypothetical protein
MSKFFSGCLVFLFIIALSLAMGLLALKYTVLSPNFHKNNLRRTHFYEQSLAKFPPFIARLLSQNNPTTSTPNQKPAEGDTKIASTITNFGQSIQSAVTPAWFQTETEKTIDSVFAYLQGKTDTPQVTISLAPIKSSLGTNIGNTFANIPNELDTAQSIAKYTQVFNSLKIFFRYSVIILRLSIVTLLLCASLLLLLNRKNIPSALGAIGIPTIVVGGINLATSLLGYLSIGPISEQIKKTATLSGTEFLALISDVINENIKAVLNYSVIISLVVLAIGIILVVIARVLAKRVNSLIKSPPTPTPSSPVKT